MMDMYFNQTGLTALRRTPMFLGHGPPRNSIAPPIIFWSFAKSCSPIIPEWQAAFRASTNKRIEKSFVRLRSSVFLVNCTCKVVEYPRICTD